MKHSLEILKINSSPEFTQNSLRDKIVFLIKTSETVYFYSLKCLKYVDINNNNYNNY